MPIGSRGHVAYKKETTWGQVAEEAEKVLHMTSEGIIQNIEEILSKASRGIVDEPHSYQGLRTFGGPIAFEVHPANFGDILRSAIWDPVTNAAASVVKTLRACEYNWVANASCVSEKDTTDYKEGSSSIKIHIPEGVGAGVIVATKDFQIIASDISFHENAEAEDTIVTAAGNFLSAGFAVGDSIVVSGAAQAGNNATFTILAVTATIINIVTGSLTEEGATETITIKSVVDMSADDQVKFWIKCSINTDGGNFKFIIDEEAVCASPNIEKEIDALTANVWKEVTLTIDMAALSAVLSIGLEMDADLDECIVWIDNIRRIDTAGAAGTAKDHVFTPNQGDFGNSPLYSYTMEVHRDQAVDAWQFLGCVVNTLNLKFGVDDKILNGVAGILAQNVDYVTETDVGFPTTNPFVWSQAVIKIGGVEAGDINSYLESMEINIDNKLVGIPSLDGKVYIRKFYRSAPREILVNFVTDFVDRVEYDKFVLGTEQPLQIVFIGKETDEAGFYYTLTIYMPKFKYLTYPIDNPGPGRISVGVTGKAKYCEDVNYAIRITLRNYTADY